MDERKTYDEDIYGWSQDQAAVLRGLQVRHDLPDDLDLEHVIEEIEGVGSSELNAVRSYLRLLLAHLVKLAASSRIEPEAHWRVELVVFHNEVLTRYSPSMRHVIGLDLLWRRALREAAASLAAHDETLPAGLAGPCPFVLDDFLGEEIALDALIRALDTIADRPAPDA